MRPSYKVFTSLIIIKCLPEKNKIIDVIKIIDTIFMVLVSITWGVWGLVISKFSKIKGTRTKKNYLFL
ncbi:hypothetical protein SAMN05216503_2211 [Polaribacter sp. KT25b]|nr:hypothetical protein SAMN05216503_2211 [Polaribacter sp. KT25b]